MTVMYVCILNETSSKQDIFCSSSNRFMFKLMYTIGKY